MFHKGVDQFGLEVILEAAFAGPLHGPAVRFGAYLTGFGHDLDFIGALVEPQIVKQMLQGHKFTGWVGATAHLAPYHLHPVHNPGVEMIVLTQRIVDPAASLNHARQDVVDVCDRKRVVQTITFNSPFRTHEKTIPELFLRIPFLAEQDRLAMFAPGNQSQHSLRFSKTGQVMEIAVLAKRMQYIAIADAFRRRRNYGNAVGRHPLHQLATTLGKLLNGNHGVHSLSCSQDPGQCRVGDSDFGASGALNSVKTASAPSRIYSVISSNCCSLSSSASSSSDN